MRSATVSGLQPANEAAAGPLIAVGEFEHPPQQGPRECTRRTVQLVNGTTGEVVTSRCGATNLCPRCQRRYNRETVEMLLLDAAEYAPSIWLVLTARNHLTRADTHGHLRHIRRVVKRRWPDYADFVQVEFQRRGALHINLLVKGVPAAELAELHRLVAAEWCQREGIDALPVAQWGGTISDAGGLAKYLAKTLGHGLKAEQAPPLGWKGHRTSQTRNYFVRTAKEMREEARASLKRQDSLRAAHRRGEKGIEAEMSVARELEQAAAAVWWLYEPHMLHHPGWVASRRREAQGAPGGAQPGPEGGGDPLGGDGVRGAPGDGAGAAGADPGTRAAGAAGGHHPPDRHGGSW